jgi:hypothetical protein
MKPFWSVLLALTILASPVLAMGSAIAQIKMDCSRLYKEFWEKLDREKFAKIFGDKLAGISRSVLRAYDTCQAGDAVEAKEMFDRLHMTLF